jgi:hypothetical protein
MDVWRPTETGTIMSEDLNGPNEDDASSPRFPKTRNVSKIKFPEQRKIQKNFVKNRKRARRQIYIQLKPKDFQVKKIKD